MPPLPCQHLASLQPTLCLIGRAAPRDCRSGCAGYDDGLSDHERIRWELWHRICGEAAQPAYAFTVGD